MVKRLIIVIVALGLVFSGIFGWKYIQMKEMAAMASMPPAPATVAAAGVRTESWQPYLHSVGSLVAIQGVSVTNEVAGQVSQINFESGQRVNEGDVLLRLDDRADRAELDGLIAQRRLAEVQFQRTARLLKEKSVSRSDYDAAVANLDNARAQVEAKRALIRKKRIAAPFSGLLGIRKVNLGEYLAPGSAIVPLQALDPIYVDYSLPERHFRDVSVGQSVLLEVQAHPGRVFEGRITAINPGVDPGTRNLRLRGTLDNPERVLRPGMFAQVRTLLPRRRKVLTLPQNAITYNPYGDSVFMIMDRQGELSVQRRQVQTGDIREGRVEIISGVQAGERVVSAGQVKLRNGQRVTIDNSVTLNASPSDS